MNGGTNFSSDPRYGGMPVLPDGGCWCGFDIIGNANGWDPVERDERTYAVAEQPDEAARCSRVPLWLRGEQAAHEPLAAGTRGTARGGSSEAATNATRRVNWVPGPNLYNAYASFLMGLADIGAESVQNQVMTTREWQHNFYARDRWNVNDKLTLDLESAPESVPLRVPPSRGA